MKQIGTGIGLLVAALVMAMTGLTSTRAFAADDTLCAQATSPHRTSPIADVLYSAAGNSAGVYEGVDMLHIKIMANGDGGLKARGQVRGPGFGFVTFGTAAADCDEGNLRQLMVDLRDPRTGEAVQAIITPISNAYGRHLAMVVISGYELPWPYVVIEN